MATQGERRARTRQALLDATDRTSGAVYDHFGSKDGLLFALLGAW